MKNIRKGVIPFYVGVVLTVLSAMAFHFNTDMDEQVFSEAPLVAKWTETRSRGRVEEMGRWIVQLEGKTYRYDGRLGGYDYKHIPIGTEYDLKLRPYDLKRNSSALLTGVLALVGGMIGVMIAAIGVFQFLAKEDE